MMWVKVASAVVVILALLMASQLPDPPKPAARPDL